MKGRVTICIKTIIITVRLAEELLQKSIQVCGTMRVNHGLPRDMVQEAKMLKMGEVTFHRKQNVLLVLHHDKRLVNMISTLHTAAVLDDISKCTGVTTKKPKCIVDYSTHTYGVDMLTNTLPISPSPVKL
jgi:hypothetical protein